MALNQILNGCQIDDYQIIDETGNLGMGNCKYRDNLRGCLKSVFLMDLTFELLCDVLCDPLWFNDLYLTTKPHQGLTMVHRELFQQPQL